MFFVRLLAIARKEIRHIARDPQITFMAVIAPAFVLFLLAYVFAVDARTSRIGVMDLDRSPTSREVVSKLTASGELMVVRECRDYDEIGHLLTRGEAQGVLVIPHGFGESVAAGYPEPLQAVVDASDYFGYQSTSASLSMRIAALDLTLVPPTDLNQAPLIVQTRNLFNPTGKWLYVMVPGLMAAAFCFPAIAVALASTREVERGSYESLLCTPMRTSEYLLGKLLPYLAAAMLGALLAWGLARYWFQVSFRGSMGTYLSLTLAFLLALLSMGILVGTVSSSQRQAIILIVVVFFIPTFFMSGLWAPLDSHSPMTRVIRAVLPAANYVTSNRAVFLKGLGLSDLRPELSNLLRIALAALAASHILARKEIA